MGKEKPRITGNLFYYWVRCPYWAFLELHQSGGTKREISDLGQRLMEEGVKYEKRFMENSLGVAEKDMVTVKTTDLDEALMETVEHMENGVPWIYQGVLMDAHYVGRPDLLRKKKMPRGKKSRFGNYYYEPIDIKSGRSLHTAYKFQVTFYAFILDRLQDYLPPKGGIINIDEEFIPFSIKEFDREFKLTLAKIEKMLEGEAPPPFVGSACKENPWEKNCIHAAKACNHVSLVYFVTKDSVVRLVNAGIGTFDELARADVTEVQRITKTGKGVAGRMVLQAKSLSQNELIVKDRPAFPAAKRELYFDIEGDPFERCEYLFGFLDVQGGKEKYVSFVAKKPEDEEKMWRKFEAWAMKIEPGTVIYHYADYERTHLNQLIAKYGLDAKAKKVLFAGLHDLFQTVRSSVVLPLYFYSLKDVARYLGFEWRHEKAGGAQSILWYQEWLERGDPKKLQTIVDYNEDDVRATKVIKDWLAKV